MKRTLPTWCKEVKKSMIDDDINMTELLCERRCIGMANVIIKNENRKADAEHIMKAYGVDRRDSAMREAAEIAAARTNEAVRMSQNRRRYF